MQSRSKSWFFGLPRIVALVVVAAFLLIMVALGLTGVLWLNVTQRTREIGLRRAKGAGRNTVVVDRIMVTG